MTNHQLATCDCAPSSLARPPSAPPAQRTCERAAGQECATELAVPINQAAHVPRASGQVLPQTCLRSAARQPPLSALLADRPSERRRKPGLCGCFKLRDREAINQAAALPLDLHAGNVAALSPAPTARPTINNKPPTIGPVGGCPSERTMEPVPLRDPWTC